MSRFGRLFISLFHLVSLFHVFLFSQYFLFFCHYLLHNWKSKFHQTDFMNPPFLFLSLKSWILERMSPDVWTQRDSDSWRILQSLSDCDVTSCCHDNQMIITGLSLLMLNVWVCFSVRAEGHLEFHLWQTVCLSVPESSGAALQPITELNDLQKQSWSLSAGLDLWPGPQIITALLTTSVWPPDPDQTNKAVYERPVRRCWPADLLPAELTVFVHHVA